MITWDGPKVLLGPKVKSLARSNTLCVTFMDMKDSPKGPECPSPCYRNDGFMAIITWGEIRAKNRFRTKPGWPKVEVMVTFMLKQT